MILIPERTVEANYAKTVFFTEFNDIDIYVEDTKIGFEKVFSLLFSRIFKNRYKIGKIFPLGGRKEVLSQFEKEDSHRPYLYIIDGDLMLLTDDDVQSQKGLYRLPCYCLENILCDFDAIIDILDDEENIKSFEEIAQKVNFNDWKMKNEDKLFSLFLEYKVSKILNPEQQTVAYDVKKLVSCNQGLIDDEKLQLRIEEIRNSVIDKVGESQYQLTRTQIIKNFNESSFSKLNLVSGKDYILPLVKDRAKSSAKMTISKNAFIQRLAKNCDISPIEDVINYVGVKN